MATAAIPAPTESAKKAWYSLTVEEALKDQQVEESAGLSDVEVEARRAKYGPNKFADAPKESRWRVFARQYADPMQIVLLGAGIVSMFLPGQFVTGVVLVGLTLLNALLGVSQEGKASASVAALQKMMVVKSRVRRGGEVQVVDMDKLVPGDIVMVEAGDLVPADGRIVHAATLEIDESALTGESAPVPKQVEPVAADSALGDRVDAAFMNTQVTRGAATMVVESTGMQTEVGHISGMLQQTKTEQSPLTKQLNTLTNQILIIAGLALLASIAIGLARGLEFQILFLTAVAFSVSAIPTGLPAVVTTILASGTQTLAKAGAIVKRLRSVETLGSTSAINSDKTGTLTLNQMTAVEMVVGGHRYTITGEGYSTTGQINRVAGEDQGSLDRYMLPMALASDAVAKDGGLVGDPTEGALVVLAAKGGVDPVLTREAYPRLAEVPFDAAYKLMATFHRMKDAKGKDVIREYVKGAPDQLLARATKGDDGKGGEAAITEASKAKFLEENERLGRQGLRVLATGYRDLDPAKFDPSAPDLLPLVSDLTLLAIVGIVDPPRSEAKAAIATAQAAGIQIRMITGDHAVTAEAIARQLGIKGRAMAGAEFAAMSDEVVAREIDSIGVIARVAPEDKVHLVDVLKRNGHIVAMTGDGVNDAPALKKADIGVAMGITGTEVSKEAAVMILTDDNFATIVKAVELGRALYDNLMRYIRFQMAVLFGFIGTFLGASILDIASGIPFLPLQTLYINFTVQVFLAIGLGYGKAREGLMADAPRPPEQRILPRRLLTWVIVSGLVMAALNLFIIWWATPVFGESAARTMGLVTFAISNIWFALETSDEEHSILNPDVLFANATLLKTVAVSAVAMLLATELGIFQRLLGTVSLTIDQWAICLIASLAILVVAEGRKALGIHTTEPAKQAAVAPVPVPAS